LTVISQIIDSIVVLYIGLAIPKGWSQATFWTTALSNYSIKLVVAVLMTPVIYFVHHLIDRYIGEEEAHRLAESAAHGSSPIPFAG
jgi:uncharacterized PurR-regulated membrane protein YhhQ (DUF165 family)